MITPIEYKIVDRYYRYMLTGGVTHDTGINGYPFCAKYYSMNASGTLYIKQGYMWDGASGPTIQTKTLVFPSLIHDVLYQSMRKGLIPVSARAQADVLFYKMCINEGMVWFRAAYSLFFLWLFGGRYANPKKKELINQDNKIEGDHDV